MPSATPEQRQRFAAALRVSMSHFAPELIVNGRKIRRDEYVAQQIGRTSQAIRNYLGGTRVPRRLEDIQKLEAAVGCREGELAQHLGFPPPREGVLRFTFPNRADPIEIRLPTGDDLAAPLGTDEELKREIIDLLNDMQHDGFGSADWTGPDDPPAWLGVLLARFALTQEQFALAADEGNTRQRAGKKQARPSPKVEPDPT